MQYNTDVTCDFNGIKYGILRRKLRTTTHGPSRNGNAAQCSERAASGVNVRTGSDDVENTQRGVPEVSNFSSHQTDIPTAHLTLCV